MHTSRPTYCALSGGKHRAGDDREGSAKSPHRRQKASVANHPGHRRPSKRLVSAQLGKSSPAYLEFFPRGVSELHQAREAEVPGLLQRLIDAATAHLPDLVPVFQTLLDDWDAASGEAASRRAITDTSAQTRAEAFEALRKQLTKNLLTRSLHHLGRPEMAGVFFNTSLLYNRQMNGGEENDELPEPDLPLAMVE